MLGRSDGQERAMDADTPKAQGAHGRMTHPRGEINGMLASKAERVLELAITGVRGVGPA